MTKRTKQTISVVLGGMGALAFVLLDQHLLPHNIMVGIGLTALMLAGLVWALPRPDSD